MKIYCCTPKNFAADENSFFSRESGLFCRTFQSLGIDSRAIMLLPGYSQDAKDILRVTYADLCDPDWWKSLQLDGLVLYSWGSPQFTDIALAVKRAGIRTIVYMDTCGLVSRLVDWKAWCRYAWKPAWARGGNILLRLFALFKLFIDSVFLITPRRRLQHLACSHAVTMPTRLGVIWMKREVTRLGRPDLAEKIFYSPHPQKTLFQYDGTKKQNAIVCVARFLPEDWPQKRPALLVKSLNAFLAQNPGWQAYVVGRGATRLTQALAFQPHLSIRFVENLVHQDLVTLYQKSKIGFWASLWEGQQGAAAQALCCGCSVVAPAGPLNNCFEDYVSLASGRVVSGHGPQAFADSLVLESESWEQNYRIPENISRNWVKVFHADKIARNLSFCIGFPN